MLSQLGGRTVAFIASTGGHLEQATRWSERLGVSKDSLFISFDSPQSRGLLEHRRHAFVDYIRPRSVVDIVRASVQISRILAAETDIAIAVSTGASIALAAYVPLVFRGGCMYYIESFSRFHGPSVSGRLVSPLPRVHAFTQHRRYSSDRWKVTGSLFEGWYHVPAKSSPRPESDGIKVFVTLGTIKPYRFDSLVSGILKSVTRADRVVWQLGATDRSNLPGESFELVSSEEFDEYATTADVVVTHAGVGSLMRLLDLGVSPIVVPRLAARGEHVDDHQVQAASELAKLGLVESIDSEELDWETLHTARPSIRSTGNA